MGQWRSLEPAAALAAVARAPDYGEPVRAWRLWEVGLPVDLLDTQGIDTTLDKLERAA